MPKQGDCPDMTETLMDKCSLIKGLIYAAFFSAFPQLVILRIMSTLS
jgi:hypothetical protein